jgi:hypothetical protein
VAEDGAHILPPAQEIREIAARRSPQRTGAVEGVGLEFELLGPDGRIRRDYQFIES